MLVEVVNSDGKILENLPRCLNVATPSIFRALSVIFSLARKLREFGRIALVSHDGSALAKSLIELVMRRPAVSAAQVGIPLHHLQRGMPELRG